jgi:hypothetical protein
MPIIIRSIHGASSVLTDEFVCCCWPPHRLLLFVVHMGDVALMSLPSISLQTPIVVNILSLNCDQSSKVRLISKETESATSA